ncbi:hypothetical protein HPG69_005932 [Diceros bicornis minor]|uniref:Secretion-regulating guanine nucleotide exchange factor n=1 Tax=Diceros bicornis minor TaxID=77932 RepID=A0A7J7ET88_DICBM|nr:hypothetical protein HPG69_005932 [Diceros bicornis minor]
MAREQSASEAGPAAAALFAWGANSYGQLGLGHKEDVLLPQQLNDFCKPRCVRRITGGGGHSAVVTVVWQGHLLTMSPPPQTLGNKSRDCGLNVLKPRALLAPLHSLCSSPPSAFARWSQISYFCHLRFKYLYFAESGQVLSCGSNSFGQLGVPHGPRRCVVPQAIELLREKVVSIAAGLRHALAATGLEDSKATCVVAGSCHSASLTAAGELYVWGSNKHGQLASQAAFLPVPQKIEAPCFQNEKVTAVWSGWTHLVAQTGERAAENLRLARASGGQLFQQLWVLGIK